MPISELLAELLKPFAYEFFRNGALAASIIGVLCGMLGVYIVLRGMSYIGHGLSHAIFGGAAVTFVMNWNFYLGAGLWGFLAAILITQTARRYRISADAAIGIITTASFAFGIAVISRQSRFVQDFESSLFGSILGVTPDQILAAALVTVLVGAAIFVLYKHLLFMTFDNETAFVYGVRTGWLDTFFSLALAAATIVSMQILGVTLIAASIVIPPIIGRLLTDRFERMMIYAMVTGGVTAFVGIYLSYFFDTSSGSTIVLVQTAVFLVALVINTLRGRNRMGSIHYH
jgi:manganese/iron transport system permease protein/iron/zinc/copper transport system permease protein